MHSPDLKATVTAGLLAGQGITELARRYNVPKGTVAGWRDEVFRTEPNDELNGNRLAWLPIRGANWHENFEGYIDDVMYGLRVQVAYLSRPEVLERTDYAAIVDAHGTLADRVARIAEAVGHIDAPANRLESGAAA